jgi:hypothetical protein
VEGSDEGLCGDDEGELPDSSSAVDSGGAGAEITGDVLGGSNDWDDGASGRSDEAMSADCVESHASESICN